MPNPVGDYNAGVAAAKNALGKDGHLPKPRVDVLKELEHAGKAMDKLNAMRAEMQKVTVEISGELAKVKAAAKLYADMIGNDKFGLDPKDAKQKKTIDEASKAMLDGLGAVEKDMDWFTDHLDRLDKILVNLSAMDK